ncbi:delta-60 repeat domain-containing protein [Nocardioides sp.]|uniref:delta-60 repeat domain-containing protein n=1 Tax=Nocardioides sp. TaxID=35761 RepID=UPI002B27696B|nr:delta-60 repeat domain-containing protein [Nocardioides sp.]
MTPPEHPSTTAAPSQHSRRVLLGGAAWTAPAIVLATAAPASATLSGAPRITVVSTRGDISPGIGSVLVSLEPDPDGAQTAVALYDDLGARTTGFAREGASGSAGLYRLTFSTTTAPVPAAIEVTINVAPFGSATTTVTMAAPGTLDTTFADADLSASGQAIVVQPDGKILVAGNFTQYAGNQQQRLVRFNADGSRDTTLPNPWINQAVYALALQADGKILVTGNFQKVGPPTAVDRTFLARLNSDGTLDTTFADPLLNQLGYGVAVQPDGKVLVAGYFTSAGGSVRNYLARFDADGTLDTSFQDPALDAFAFTVALQPDGKVLVAGDFTTVGGVTRNRLARINTDGSLDTGFADPGLNGRVVGLALQDDGKIVASGEFTEVGGVSRPYVARFDTNGTVDPTFADPALDAPARRVLVQPDGKVLVSGEFTTVGATTRRRLARLTSNGALDTAFADPTLAGIDPTVRGIGIARQSDGKVLVTGNFTTAGSGATTHRSVARFHGSP